LNLAEKGNSLARNRTLSAGNLDEVHEDEMISVMAMEVEVEAEFLKAVLPAAHLVEEAIRALEPDLSEADLKTLEEKAEAKGQAVVRKLHEEFWTDHEMTTEVMMLVLLLLVLLLVLLVLTFSLLLPS